MMRSYIEFTTLPSNPHTGFTLGNPVHDGKMPYVRFRPFGGVRINRREVEFADTDMADAIYGAMVRSHDLIRRSIGYDCVAFAALMSGVEMKDRRHNPFEKSDITTTVSDAELYVGGPLNLGRTITLPDGEQRFSPRHTVVPAHMNESTPNYIHKIGDAGPLCLSGLGAAMRMYGCDAAHPVIVEA